MAQIIADDEDAVDQQKSAATASNGPNYDVEFGDEATMAKGDGFDKIAPPDNDKTKVVRVSMLTDVLTPKKHWVHFVTNKGSFLCASKRDEKGLITEKALCCKKLDNDPKQNAQLNVLVLVLYYKNADSKTGKYIQKKDKEGNAEPITVEWSIGFIKLSRSGFRRVSNLIEEDQKPHEFDMMISHKDSGIGFEYNKIASKALFRRNDELLKEVFAAAASFKDGVALTKKLGKRLNDLEWAALLGGASSKASDASVDDVSDL
jgi:hypothetical protein